MTIKENIKLAPFTTFKIGGPARFFCIVKNQFDALEAYDFAQDNRLQVFILGGGSNVLISDEGFGGLVAKIENKGIEIASQDESSVALKIASGENWDGVVRFAVQNNWWGIENLSHIPGSTGAIAVQNVGAYGQEASKVIKSVTVFNKTTHQILELSNSECGFAYRKSIFNASDRGKYIIFYITLILSKIPKPILAYRDLKNQLADTDPKLEEIRQTVIKIRDQKYPFPTQAKNGNAGSFFKNPALAEPAFQSLEQKLAREFNQPAADRLNSKAFRENGEIKVPAAYLMELCGLKDLQEGGVKINHSQPLVIINETGRASAKDVLNLAGKVIQVVKKRTDIVLRIEPELVGFLKNELSDIMPL